MTKLQELDVLLKSYRPTEKEFEWAKMAGEQRNGLKTNDISEIAGLEKGRFRQGSGSER